MRKLVLLIGLVCSFAFANAQTYLIQEDFEGSTYVMTSSSTTSNSWAVTSSLAASGQKADSAVVAINDTTYLTSDAFSTTGSSVVYLEFDQIAKLSFYDAATIEYSTDNGATWTKITSGYLGTGQFINIGSKFNSTSYPSWLPATANAIPDSSWWQHEKFNLSSVLSNVAQAKIRFVLIDGNGLGAMGNYGWLLDNIEVWKPSSQEASIVDYHLPLALPSGCGLGDETIQISVSNNGSANINGNLVAYFQREGQSPVSEIIPNIIVPYDTISYTFSNTIDLFSLVDTNYQVKVWVSLTGDPNQGNDTLIDTIISRVPLADPVINDTTIPWMTNVTLTASHPDTLIWYSDPLAVNMLSIGASYTTPVLSDTSVFYVQARDNIPVSTYQIGNGTTTNTGTGYPTPYGNWYYGSKDQYLILASELSALGVVPGDIKKLSFDVSTANGVALQGFEIKMGHTTQSAMTSSFVTGLTSVYSVTSYTETTGWNEHVFQTPFNWNGTDNLVIEVCFNNSSYTNNAQVYNHTTTFTSSVNYHADAAGVCAQSSGTTYSVRPNMKLEAGSLSMNCPSRVKPVVVNISGIPVNDAGLVAITPDGGAQSGSQIPITVDLINRGVDTLKKADIYYSINDSVYPVYNWTGSLLYDSVETVTLSNYQFGSGVYRIKSWTSMPKDSVDGYNANDTISSFVYVCLNGTFTLGSPTADFADFAALQVVLDSVGLCGPATINILPGTYNTQLLFGAINGTSDTSRLILQSSTGNNADVILQYAASSTTDNYVLQFEGASYVTVKDITIRASGSTYAYAVVMINGAQHNSVEGCYIKSDVTSSTYGNGVRIYYSPIPNNYNKFEDNLIEGGYYGVYHYGSSSGMQKGNLFINNEIKNWYYYGLYSYYGDSVQIIGNYIHDGQYTYNYHLYNYYAMNGYRVIGNKVVSSPQRHKCLWFIRLLW